MCRGEKNKRNAKKTKPPAMRVVIVPGRPYLACHSSTLMFGTMRQSAIRYGDLAPRKDEK